MKTDELNGIAMQIIAHAGDSKSSSLEAANAAMAKNSDLARALLQRAKDELLLAHKEHTKVLVEEARDPENFRFNLLMVHASDHLAVAEVSKDYAEMLMKVCDQLRKEAQND